MRRTVIRKRVVFIVVLVVLILFMIPFYLLVLNTFKTTAQFTITISPRSNA